MEEENEILEVEEIKGQEDIEIGYQRIEDHYQYPQNQTFYAVLQR